MLTIGSLLPVALIIIVGAAYGRGQRNHPRTPRQIGAFYAGLGLLLACVLPPLMPLSDSSFAARVAQRMLLASVIPPLLWLGNPLPLLAGDGRWVSAEFAKVRPLLQRVATPAVGWSLFVANFWLWHDADLTSAAMRLGWLHAIESGALLGTGLLYWWHITRAEPHLHPALPPIVHMLYAFAGVIPIKVVGVILLFQLESGAAAGVIDATMQIGTASFNDQSLGALLLWVVGGTPFAYAAIALAGRYLQGEDDKPHLPHTALLQRETWRHPGLFE